MDEFTPIPESSGRLGPPRRNPPTAVGLLTPPRPPRRPHSGTYRSSLRTRLAQGFVGVLAIGVGTGVTALASGVIGVVIGAAVAAIGAPLLFASVRSDRERELRLAPRSSAKHRRAA